MNIHLTILNKEHYPRLYQLDLKNEGDWIPPYEEWVRLISSRFGWVVWDSLKVIGYVSFSGYKPMVDMCLHVTIDKEYHGKWLTRKMLSNIADLAFKNLNLRRVTSYHIDGVTDNVGDILLRLGFKIEGRSRKAVKIGDHYYDRIDYGILREECGKWL